MRVDYLLEIVTCRIDIIQYFALKAAVILRDYQIDKLRHLDILGRLVVHKIVVVQIAAGVMEEATHSARGRHIHVIQTTAALTLMRVGDVDGVTHIQIEQDALQLLGSVVDNNLLERTSLLHHLLDIVITDTHIEDIALGDGVASISIIDILRPSCYVAYGTSVEF